MGQRIFGLGVGPMSNLNDHDELRKDPTFAVLAGKLSPVLRTDCEPLAGKTQSPGADVAGHASKYHKIDCDDAQVDALLVDLFLEAHERAPREIVLDLDNTDIPLHGEQEGRFFHNGHHKGYGYLPLYVFCGRHLLLARQRRETSRAVTAQSRRSRALSRRSARNGDDTRSSCAPTAVSATTS